MTIQRGLVISVCLAAVVLALYGLTFLPPVRQLIGNFRAGAVSTAQLSNAMRHPRYAETERELRAEGIPTRLADILGTPPAPAQNAAVIYRRLSNNLYTPSPDEIHATEITLSSGKAQPADWSAARRFLAQHPDVVALSEAAACRPLCVVPRKDTGDPAGILLPELASMRRAARIVTIRSMVLAADGKPLDAVREETLGFHIAGHAKADTGIMITSLVGLACEAITLSGMENILRSSRGDPGVAKAIDRAVTLNWHRTDPGRSDRSRDSFRQLRNPLCRTAGAVGACQTNRLEDESHPIHLIGEVGGLHRS